MPRISKSVIIDNGTIRVTVLSNFHNTSDKTLLEHSIELILKAIDAY